MTAQHNKGGFVRFTVLITFFLMRAFSAEATIEREDIGVFFNPDQNTQKLYSKILVVLGEDEFCLSDLGDKKGLLPPSLRSELTDESELSESEIPACDENIDNALVNLAGHTVYKGEEVAGLLPFMPLAVGGVAGGCLFSVNKGDYEFFFEEYFNSDMNNFVKSGSFMGAGALMGALSRWGIISSVLDDYSLMRKIKARGVYKALLRFAPVKAIGLIGLSAGGGFLFGKGFCDTIRLL